MAKPCPHCRSEQTLTFAAAYEQGSGSIAGYVSRSNLAERCAPPVENDVLAKVGGCAFLVGGALVLLLMAVMYVVMRYIWRGTSDGLLSAHDLLRFVAVDSVIWAVVVCVIVANVMMWLAAKTHKNDLERMDKWRRSWVCLQCGMSFIP